MKAVGIGQPIIRLSDELNSDEIRLEGAEVSRDTYASLFAIYGTKYGAGDGVLTFNLPDFRNRTIYGAENFGYVEAELPNIKGTFIGGKTDESASSSQEASGAFKIDTTVRAFEGGAGPMACYTFDASKFNPIYKDGATVKSPGIKVRVVTRYK